MSIAYKGATVLNLGPGHDLAYHLNIRIRANIKCERHPYLRVHILIREIFVQLGPLLARYILSLRQGSGRTFTLVFYNKVVTELHLAAKLDRIQMIRIEDLDRIVIRFPLIRP
jgi:hypothetical protein